MVCNSFHLLSCDPGFSGGGFSPVSSSRAGSSSQFSFTGFTGGEGRKSHMSRGGAGGGATTVSDPAPSSPFIGGGGGGGRGVSSSSVLTMSVSGATGQLGMTGGGTALPKLELKEKNQTKMLRFVMKKKMFGLDDVLSRIQDSYMVDLSLRDVTDAPRDNVGATGHSAGRFLLQ